MHRNYIERYFKRNLEIKIILNEVFANADKYIKNNSHF